MAKESEAKEWIGNPFGKEDSPNSGVDLRKGIPHAAYDDVLKDSGVSSEG